MILPLVCCLAVELGISADEFLMDTVESQVLILGRQPYRETSHLLQVLCAQEGRVSLVARGLSSPKASGRWLGALAPLSLSRVAYRIRSGADIGTVTEAELVEGWPNLRSNLEAFAWACFSLQVVSRSSLARADCSVVFGQLIEMLHFFNAGHFRGQIRRLVSFQENLARELGLSLGLDSCQVCSVRSGLDFVRLTGTGNPGAVCERCALPTADYFPWIFPGKFMGRGTASMDWSYRNLALVVPALWERLLGEGLDSAEFLRQVVLPWPHLRPTKLQ